MVGTKPEAISDYLNALAESAIVETANNSKELIKAQINNYSVKLETYLAEAKLEREQKIRHLLNNLEIAKKLGVVKNNFNSSSFISSSAFVLRKDEVLEEALPLWYLYGQHALEQELAMLRREPISYPKNKEVASVSSIVKCRI
jgi:LPS O-antigen subunit length determinant protein (WzzB/FepE family)